MTLKYLARLEADTDYYIEKCFDDSDLTKLYKELEEGEMIIKEYKKRIFEQFQKVSQVVEYIRIEAHKEQNHYSSDKKVYISVKAYTVKHYDGKEVKSNLIYKSIQKFSYADIKKASLYVKQLLIENPGSRYINHTKYKQMEVSR